ncbi:MAG: 50S ribosomal protein L11 methyltransferase [Anaerolineae bacterium]|nr:50S ribosomal protein L11 methyltransferase [Anaerolineae bacterium]
MDFTEIAIIGIDGEAAEVVADLFNRYGHGGAVIESLAPDFEKVTVRTVLPAEDKERLREVEVLLALIGQALPKGLPEPRLQPVGESDWATSWREHFHVVRIGQRFVIKPSWREYSPSAEDIVIEIDPGLAFGSGLHPTTQLCLKIFEEMDLHGQELFDVGTGSGVLSIAALKSGATIARAVDVDDVAVRVADENFERNGLMDRVETAVGSSTENGGRQWPLVVANILAHILIEIMPGLAAALSTDGQLILSGMIADQETDVTRAAQAHQLEIVERHSHEDWVALIAQRDSSSSPHS